MPQPRNIKDGPFGWYVKAANRRIREAFDASRNVSSALAVYMALTEIASDEANETFEQTVGYIAGKAGVSPRTVTTISPGLQAIGLVSIRENTIPGTKLKGPNTYTLLSTSNNCASTRNSRKQPPLPRIEEHKKNPQKNDNEKASGRPSDKNELSAQSSSSLGFDESTKARKRFASYCRERGGKPTEKGFLKWNRGSETEIDLPDTRQGCNDAINALRKVEERAGRLSDRGLMTGPARAQYLRLKKHREQLPTLKWAPVIASATCRV